MLSKKETQKLTKVKKKKKDDPHQHKDIVQNHASYKEILFPFFWILHS